ncbi:MAG TPA: alpha/beta fold hydrolase [Candidatus Nanoarchaeia archaeon]|nr:alpha/beta fold hydrolase [Candidatus Nanoarchaeia archaeon]
MKRIILIHGWGGFPEEAWFPWLKRELEKNKIQLIIPSMPHPDTPTIEEWVTKLAKLVGTPDKELILIGHSIGCQTILRYLQTQSQKIAGCVLVAPWFTLSNIETEAEEKIAEPWIKTPFDFQKIKRNAQKITAIFSTNDEFVPLSNTDLFKKNLGAAIIIEQNKGHFSQSDNLKTLPSALNAVVSLL